MIAESAPDATTVVVAHEHALFRAAIRAGLDQEPDLVVVGEAHGAAQAMVEVMRLRPTVLLLDAQLPPHDGVAHCPALKALGLSMRIVILGPAADQLMLQRAFEAGADGYACHQLGLSEVVGATRSVARGEAFVPGSMLGSLLRSLIERRREADYAATRLQRLSRREKQVFALVVNGQGPEAIAAELVISLTTARTHLQNVFRKLEVHSRLEVAALAMEYDLMDELEEGP